MKRLSPHTEVILAAALALGTYWLLAHLIWLVAALDRFLLPLLASLTDAKTALILTLLALSALPLSTRRVRTAARNSPNAPR